MSLSNSPARRVPRIVWLLAMALLPLLPVWSAGGHDTTTETARPLDPRPTKTVTSPPLPESAESTTPAAAPESAEPASLVPIVEREVCDYADFNGWIEPVERVELRPRASGTIMRIEFQAGALVKRGDLLFTLDARAFEIELEKSDAERERARTRIERKLIALENVEKLAKEGRMSRQTVRDVTGDVHEAEMDARIAQATWERARLNLAMTRVVAPIDGRIGAPLLTEGNVAVADATHLATIVALDPLYVAFEVDEPEALGIRRLLRTGALPGATGAKVTAVMGLAGETGFPRAVTLVTLDTVFDPATHTTRWRALASNADQSLMPGQSARVRIATSAPHKALLIPRAAVFRNGAGDYVSVALDAGGKREDRAVRLGAAHDDLVVVREGRLSLQDRLYAPSADRR